MNVEHNGIAENNERICRTVKFLKVNCVETEKAWTPVNAANLQLAHGARWNWLGGTDPPNQKRENDKPTEKATCTHVETRNRICIWVIWGGVGVTNNVHVNLHTHGLYGAQRNKICIWVIWGGVGVGWG